MDKNILIKKIKRSNIDSSTKAILISKMEGSEGLKDFVGVFLRLVMKLDSISDILDLLHKET